MEKGVPKLRYLLHLSARLFLNTLREGLPDRNFIRTSDLFFSQRQEKSGRWEEIAGEYLHDENKDISQRRTLQHLSLLKGW